MEKRPGTATGTGTDIGDEHVTLDSGAAAIADPVAPVTPPDQQLRRRRDYERAAERQSLRQIVAPFLVGQHARLALLSVAAVLGALAEAAVLVLIARIAFALTSDSARIQVSAGPVHATMSVPWLVGIAAALVILRLAFQTAQALMSASTSAGVLNTMRTSLVRSYLAATWSLQSSEREGRLQELLTTYAQSGTNAILQLSQGVVAICSLAAFVVAALVVNAAAALAVAASAVLIGLVLRPLRLLMRRYSRRSADASLEFATAITEFAATAQEVRVIGVEDQVRSRIETLSERSSARFFRTRFLAQLVPGIYQCTALLVIVLTLGIVYAAGAKDLAALGAVVLITLRSMTYGQVLQTSLQSLHEGAPYLQTLNGEELRYRAAAVPRRGRPIDGIGELRFEDVRFEYETGVPVLRDVSFAVEHGEIIGIVGPSGAGKSTLVQLLLRLHEPTHGRVLADGCDVRDIALDAWYRHVAFVPQETHLFAGSVEENIRFFRPEVSRSVVEAAARQAHLHDDLMSFPNGYDTAVGERGGELSGGQGQRLCIARALVTAPNLLVLDEPTSTLDARSEALMRDTMAALAPHTTVFVIAHRLTTLSICNRIMVFDHGKLQGFDDPGRLKHDDPFYREAMRLSGLQ